MGSRRKIGDISVQNRITYASVILGRGIGMKNSPAIVGGYRRPPDMHFAHCFSDIRPSYWATGSTADHVTVKIINN